MFACTLMNPRKKRSPPLSFVNKKASFSYTILQRFIAGIKLRGTEIKSIRQRHISLTDAYGSIDAKGELWAKGIHIKPYEPAGLRNHEPTRPKKLLLAKQELRKLSKEQKKKGFTIAVLRLFINEKGFAKVEVAVAKGNTLYDKRRRIKERDLQRKMNASTL